MNYNGKNINDTDRLRILREDECAGELTPLQANPETTDALNDREIQDRLEDSGITKLQALFEHEWQQRVRSLTAERIGEMAWHEQDAMESWIERNLRLLSEKLCLLRRHKKAAPTLPERLRSAS